MRNDRSQNLKISYEERVVVKDFSFNIEEGEMVSIIGPNGSRKINYIKNHIKTSKQQEGVIYLEKEDISHMNIKNIAKKMSTLSQA